MKFGLVLLILLSGCVTFSVPAWLPATFLGHFADDYDNAYFITHDRWVHEGYATYNIHSWNEEEHFIIAQNDADNPSDAGLWTRIDWVELDGMLPYTWAFCLTVYDATSSEEATLAEPADRENPRTGCNGFPFSRMKRATLGELEG